MAPAIPVNTVEPNVGSVTESNDISVILLHPLNALVLMAVVAEGIIAYVRAVHP